MVTLVLTREQYEALLKGELKVDTRFKVAFKRFKIDPQVFKKES